MNMIEENKHDNKMKVISF